MFLPVECIVIIEKSMKTNRFDIINFLCVKKIRSVRYPAYKFFLSLVNIFFHLIIVLYCKLLYYIYKDSKL